MSSLCPSSPPPPLIKRQRGSLTASPLHLSSRVPFTLVSNSFLIVWGALQQSRSISTPPVHVRNFEVRNESLYDCRDLCTAVHYFRSAGCGVSSAPNSVNEKEGDCFIAPRRNGAGYGKRRQYEKNDSLSGSAMSFPDRLRTDVQGIRFLQTGPRFLQQDLPAGHRPVICPEQVDLPASDDSGKNSRMSDGSPFARESPG